MEKVLLVDRVVFGHHCRCCPRCGGELTPAFGCFERDDGVMVPVIDPNRAICRECGDLFEVSPA